MEEDVIYFTDLGDEYDDYKLCYVEEIPKTYTDWDPDSKELMKTNEYKEFIKERNKILEELKDTREKEEGYRYLTGEDYRSVERKLDPTRKFERNLCEYPHPVYSQGYTHYFYFTNDLEKQWGDDWDDIPYEHNAGTPYNHNTDLIIVPFIIEYFKLEKMVEVERNYEDLLTICPLFDDIEVRFPCDGYLNSPYSIDMINTGAIPWLYGRICRYKEINPSETISIMAGENPKSVMYKLNKFNRIIYKK